MWALVSACAPSRSRELSAIRGHPRGPVGCAHQVLSLLAEILQRSTSRVDCTSVTDVPSQRLVTAVFQVIDDNAQPSLEEHIPICMTSS